MKGLYDNFTARNGFDQTHSANVGAGATATLFSYRIPAGATLLITHFHNYVDLLAAWAYLVGTMYLNGSPVDPLAEVKDQTYGTEPRELGKYVEVRGGDLIEYKVKNNGAAAYNTGVVLKGKFGTWRRRS